jgi:hypothetical protein
MIRVLKRDGLMIMTCATFGRAQHGTSLASPESSPLTVRKGQDYYRNLIEADFDFINLRRFFSEFFFVTDYSNSDLYFAGIGIEADSLSTTRLSNGKEKATQFYSEIARAGLR